MKTKNSFKGKDFLTLMDYSSDDINFILNIAQDFKHNKINRENYSFLADRIISMVFEKQSTRTRFSFQSAIAQLGMHSFFSIPSTMQLSRGETIKDTARILDKYCDALVIRTFGQEY
jgi:ornithine carbamoyltransferase